MTTKKIELTDAQYLQLTKLIYLGYWMSTAHKDETDPVIDDIEQHIYSYSSLFSAGNIVEYDKSMNKFLPASDFEEEMETPVQEYDDYVFWEELSWRLAERDFLRKYDQAQILCMTGDEILREKNTIADRYFKEFGIYGLENLHFNL